MRIRDRAKVLLQSLLLPVAAVVLLAVFTLGSVMLSAQDRAIVWAEGTPSQLGEVQRRVSANAWFKHGRTRAATVSNPLPPECGSSAHEFSFGSLGEFEAQAAREILELIALEAGARTCLSNVFIINELPEPSRQTWMQEAASTVLGASIIPLATVLLVFALMSGRFNLGALPGSRTRPNLGLAWGIGAGVGLSLVLALVHSFGGVDPDPSNGAAAMTVANVGYPLAFALVIAVPATEELAFRGWMIPLAERAIGSLPAGLASSMLYAAASLPADAWSAAGHMLLGATYAALYLRTRSVLACIVANVMASATAFWVA